MFKRVKAKVKQGIYIMSKGLLIRKDKRNKTSLTQVQPALVLKTPYSSIPLTVKIRIRIKQGIYIMSNEGIIVFTAKLKNFLIKKIKEDRIARANTLLTYNGSLIIDATATETTVTNNESSDITIAIDESSEEILLALDEPATVSITEPVHIPSLAEIERLWFANLSPIPTILANEKVIRVNIVTDTLNKNSLYGGVATSIIFAIVLTNKLNCPLRIITRDNSAEPAAFFDIAKSHKLTIPENYEFYNFPYNVESSFLKKLPVSDNDIFISTSWWSSYVVREMNMRKKYLYILQEYEKIFYPNSDQHVMADSIFNDETMLPIVNTKVLYDFYGLNNYKHIHDNGLYFEPAFPHIALPSRTSFIQKKKKLKLFFYNRPQMPRNLAFTGLKLLDTAIERGIIKTADWDICLAGQNVTTIKFCDGYVPKNYGKLDWDNYPSFISDVDLCLALMLAPCPSYIPLDLASAGAVVLTNTYKNKISLDYYSKNILCSKLDIESMLKNLQLAINLAQNFEKRYDNAISDNINKHWDKAFANLIKNITQII